MHTAIFCWLIACIATSGLSGQTPVPAPNSQHSPGIVILGFSFGAKDQSRLELLDISNRIPQPGGIPAGDLPFRAEMRGPPVPGKQYLAYERRTQRNSYATLTLRNSGTKAVKAIDWEYIFPHFVRGKEVASRSVHTKTKLPPGASITLSSMLPHDDCGVRYRITYGVEWISQSCGRRNPQTTGWYKVGAKIRRVQLEDRSVWRSP